MKRGLSAPPLLLPLLYRGKTLVSGFAREPMKLHTAPRTTGKQTRRGANSSPASERISPPGGRWPTVRSRKFYVYHCKDFLSLGFLQNSQPEPLLIFYKTADKDQLPPLTTQLYKEGCRQNRLRSTVDRLRVNGARKYNQFYRDRNNIWNMKHFFFPQIPKPRIVTHNWKTISNC